MPIRLKIAVLAPLDPDFSKVGQAFMSSLRPRTCRRRPSNLTVDDVREAITRQMRIHEAEDEVARYFGVAIDEAVRLVYRAIGAGVLDCSFGKVRPARWMD